MDPKKDKNVLKEIEEKEKAATESKNKKIFLNLFQGAAEELLMRPKVQKNVISSP